MERPEVAEFFAGPADGRELQIDPTVEAVVVGGATYRRDGDVFRHDELRQVPSDDVVLDEIIKIFGEDVVRQMLAVVEVREALHGNFPFHQGLTARMNRRASGGTP